MKELPKIILASASPRRHGLLSLLGLPFDVLPTQTAERRLPGESAHMFGCRLSREKAQMAAMLIDGGALILAADTIVIYGDDVLGKPRHAEEATAILQRLRGRTHEVCTAVTLSDNLTGCQSTELMRSPVTMRDYSDEEIAAYLATGDPFDKAGAYAIQHAGFHPVVDFKHCFTNVMGLPLCLVSWMLERQGIEVPSPISTTCQFPFSGACRLEKHFF